MKTSTNLFSNSLKDLSLVYQKHHGFAFISIPASLVTDSINHQNFVRILCLSVYDACQYFCILDSHTSLKLIIPNLFANLLKIYSGKGLVKIFISQLLIS